MPMERKHPWSDWTERAACRVDSLPRLIVASRRHAIDPNICQADGVPRQGLHGVSILVERIPRRCVQALVDRPASRSATPCADARR